MTLLLYSKHKGPELGNPWFSLEAMSLCPPEGLLPLTVPHVFLRPLPTNRNGVPYFCTWRRTPSWSWSPPRAHLSPVPPGLQETPAPEESPCLPLSLRLLSAARPLSYAAIFWHHFVHRPGRVGFTPAHSVPAFAGGWAACPAQVEGISWMVGRPQGLHRILFLVQRVEASGSSFLK